MPQKRSCHVMCKIFPQIPCWNWDESKMKFPLDCHGKNSGARPGLIFYVLPEVNEARFQPMGNKLEQLECLHSEIPPATPWLPILVIHIRSQVKRSWTGTWKLFIWQQQKYKHETIPQRVHDSMFLLSGDPYKGAECTACVRATHGYYNA